MSDGPDRRSIPVFFRVFTRPRTVEVADLGGVTISAPDTLVGQFSAGQGMFTWYTRLLSPLLAGYLLLDRTFAYIHIPGTPLFIGEIVLGIGVIASAQAIRDIRTPSKYSEPVFFALGLLCTWGMILSVSGIVAYGLDAARDSALWYYSLFAFLTYAALVRTPAVLQRWIDQFGRFTPLLLVWLPTTLVIAPAVDNLTAGSVGSANLILNTKTGDSAIAALLGLGYLWLFPERFSARGRAVWSTMALAVIALAGTQNRGGLLAVVAGAVVGLAFHPDRRALVKRNSIIIITGLSLSFLMPDIAYPGLQGRHYTAGQLIENIWSITDPDGAGALSSTAKFRTELWSRIMNKQVDEGHLIDGLGFGPNLAADVGVYAGQSDSFRSPHNSHLDILARLGLVGLLLWIVMWTCWYWRMITGCRRLAERGFHARQQVAILCQMVVTAVMVSSYFDPQLEGPQVAIPLWTLVGLGLAAVSERLDNRGAEMTDPVRVRD